MNFDEMNEYIKHYVEKDRTQSAIMITAPWGTGKSYYINNVLVPFLKRKTNLQCIIVSLYGLKELNDVSKSIFLESKFRIINKKNAKINVGKILGKTIAKGVASFFGVDLNVDEKDLNKLYKSIDLSNKLIILEDVERSQISILELLGFVNSLVEQDGAKVLLITNENEIINYVAKKISDKKSEMRMVLDEKSLEYLKVKEKTISDTITFYSPNSLAIKNIVNSFNNPTLNKIMTNEVVDEIDYIKEKTRSLNLRSFIFACQKTIDLIEKCNCDMDEEFVKILFLGNVAFCMRKKNEDDIKWPSTEKGDSSTELGTFKFPLFRFSYDYICNQYVDVNTVVKANRKYCEDRDVLNSKEELKAHLEVIYSYYVSTDEEILNSIQYIQQKLSNNEVPFSEYGRLANYLISIKYDLNNCDSIDECQKLMLTNLQEIDDTTTDNIRVYSGIQLEKDEANEEFVAFSEELENAISKNNKNEFDFDYKKENIENFCNLIYRNRDSFISKRCFAGKINNDKFVDLIKTCSAAEIHELRGIFQTVYRFSNIKDFYADDLSSIIDLKSKLLIMMENNDKYDSIQKKQVGYLISMLDDLIKRLS